MMNAIPAKCNACDCSEIINFYDIKNLPLLLFPVDKNERHTIKQSEISSFYCSNCFHIFTFPLSKEYSELIYGNYYRFYPYNNLESMHVHYRKPFEDFFNNTARKYFDSTTGSHQLLEIGCSSGKQLEFFEQFGFSCQGIDPSLLNETDDQRLIRGLYQDYQFGNKFQVIVARFVLEHVNYLDEFLDKIQKDLDDQGIMFLQVPNSREFMFNFIPSFLAHEHTQYFNTFSMANSMKKNNFEILNMVAENNQSIILAVCKSKNRIDVKVEKPLADEFAQFLSARKRMGSEVLSFLGKQKENVCFYGSGLIMSWILYDLDYKSICNSGTIIDDNLVLKGRYMPGTDFQVLPFDDKLVSGFKNILLTLNPVYHPEVVKKIKSNGYQGNIYAITQTEIITY